MGVITESLNAFMSLFGGGDLPQQASFRGVPFYTATEADEQFGRRLAIHDYPNSSETYAEDVGGFAGHYTLSGFVLGADAKTQFERLKAACNEIGTGELVLSVLGSFTVKCGECSARAAPTESVQRIEFDLEFYATNDAPEVALDVATGLGAFGLGDDVFDSLSDYIDEHFGFLKSDVVAALMRGDLLAMASSLAGLTGFVDMDDLTAVTRAINTLKNNAGTFLFKASNLSDILFGEGSPWRMLARSAHYMGGSSAITSFSRVATSYGDSLSTDPGKLAIAPLNPEQSVSTSNANKWPETTNTRISRNEQRELLISIHKLAALTVGYLTLANAQFDTTEDAVNAAAGLEQAYINLVHGQTATGPQDHVFSPVIDRGYLLHEDSEVRQSFEAMRVYALQALNTADNITYQVQERTLRTWEKTSVLNLAYLTRAEYLSNEDELLLLTVKLAEENNEVFKCSGIVKVLM